MADIDKEQLRSMVLSFRVSELQVFLGLANQSKCGRKTELLQRALLLVDRGLPVPLQLKVRELYRKFMPQRVPVVGLNDGFSNSASLQMVKCASAISSQPVASQANANGVRRAITETELQQQQHHRAVSNSNSMMTASVTRPDVSLKRLPFYDIIAEVMKPTCLVPRTATRIQESRLNFTLTQQNVDDINSHRNTQFADRVDYGVQIQLRFCLTDSSTKQPDCFPANITVKVNNMVAQLPNLIPTNKPGVEPKRPNRPVDITRLCRLSPTVINTINVSWTVEESKRHCASVCVVRKLDSDILLQRLKRSGVRRRESTIALVQEKLSLDQDSDIATTSLRISLLCPLGKMRITVPCRASTCNHLQCFDAATYIMMNEKKPTWICPICDLPAEFPKLFIDGLVTEILKDSADATEAELTDDGKWSITKKEEQDRASPMLPPAPAVCPTVQCTVKNEVDRSVVDSEGSIVIVGDVVDLTESDDEDMTTSTSTALPMRSSQCPPDIFGTSSNFGTNSSKCNSVSPHSSGGLSSPSPVAVFDLSPVRVMPGSPQGPLVPSPQSFVMTPPPLGPIIPKSPRSFMITPPPLGPPPLAHPGLHLGYHPPTSSKLSSHSLFGCSSSYPPLPSTSGGSPYQYPGSLFRNSPCDPLSSSGDAVLDFLSLVSSFSDYSNFSLPPNTFDYLYQTGPNTAAASAGSSRGLDAFAGALHGASSPRS